MKKQLLILTTLFAASAAQAYQINHTYHLTILHLNDSHGRFWPNSHGEYGMAAHKTMIDRIRQEVKKQGGSVIVLHAGDINTGVPESDLLNARPDIEALNAMGVDAMTLGNHEFDNPLQLLDKQEHWAHFPFLSANTTFKKTGKYLVHPYTILHKNGLKIAIVGLTTEDTATAGNPEYTSGINFQKPINAVHHIMPKVNAAHPDIKIALTHMGYYPDAQYGSNAPGDVTLARSLPKGTFNLIIGGHTHTTVCMNPDGSFNFNFKAGDSCQPDQQNGTWIMQAGEWGKYLGRADFEYRNGHLKLTHYQLIPINLKTKNAAGEYQLVQAEIPADPTLKAKLQKYENEGSEKLSTIVGSVNGKLEGDREYMRLRQTNLGHLIAHAQRMRTGADLAIINSGGVRDSIPSGQVSYKDILKVQPFGNIVSYIDMSGAELTHYLEAVAQKQPNSGGYPQLDNVSFQVNYATGQVSNIRVGGQAINPNKTYRLSVPSYLASGGDGYPKITQQKGYVNTGFIDAEILKQYFQQHSPINAQDFAPNNQ